MTTLYLRPLPVLEALAFWQNVAKELFEGHQIQAQFVTNIEHLVVNYQGSPADLSMHPHVVALSNNLSNLRGVAQCESFLVRRWSPSHNNHPQAQVAYALVQNSSYASISTGNVASQDEAVRWVSSLSKQLKVLPKEVLVREGLQPAEREALSHQESVLAELQRSVSEIAEFNIRQIKEQSDFIKSVTTDSAAYFAGRETELTTKLQAFEADIRKREAELSESVQKRQAELEENHRSKLAEVEQREADLQRKIAEWDSRQNTVVRRKLLEDIQKALESQKVSTLSVETSGKRWIIHGLCGAAMAIGGVLVLVFANRLAGTTDPRWFHAAPLSASFLFLVSTLIYYIKWSDQWFREHAQAELRVKKLSSDILRASWLAELVLEGKQANQQLPDALMNKFSEGLFADSLVSATEHPSDQLVALIRKLSSVKVTRDGVEVTKSSAREERGG